MLHHVRLRPPAHDYPADWHAFVPGLRSGQVYAYHAVGCQTLQRYSWLGLTLLPYNRRISPMRQSILLGSGLIFLALLTTACTIDWYKPGATREEFDAVKIHCMGEASGEISREAVFLSCMHRNGWARSGLE
jgi:hypothetical protein